MAAAAGGDLNALMEMLAPDVTLWTDAGGKVKAARRVVTGRDKVARLLASDTIRGDLVGLTMHDVVMNGEPATLLMADDHPYAVGLIELSEDGEHVSAIYGVLNPDKLRRIARTLS
jgi:hypothetical protein